MINRCLHHITPKKGRCPMTRSHSFKALLVLWLLTLTTAGCATDGGIKASADDASTTASPVGQNGYSNVDLALKYYREAAELQNEARRLELEAEFYASHQDPDRAKHNLEIARDMRIAAAVANDKARSYRAGERMGGQAGLRYE